MSQNPLLNTNRVEQQVSWSQKLSFICPCFGTSTIQDNQQNQGSGDDNDNHQQNQENQQNQNRIYDESIIDQRSNQNSSSTIHSDSILNTKKSRIQSKAHEQNSLQNTPSVSLNKKLENQQNQNEQEVVSESQDLIQNNSYNQDRSEDLSKTEGYFASTSSIKLLNQPKQLGIIRSKTVSSSGSNYSNCHLFFKKQDYGQSITITSQEQIQKPPSRQSCLVIPSQDFRYSNPSNQQTSEELTDLQTNDQMFVYTGKEGTATYIK